MVSSEKRDGEVAYIVIKSLKGTSCCVHNPWSGENVVVRNAKTGKAVLKTGQKEFSFTGIEGFIAAKVFVTALRTLGRDVTRERLIDALERTRDLDVGGFTVGFGPNQRSGSQFVELTIIGRGGRFIR